MLTITLTYLLPRSRQKQSQQIDEANNVVLDPGNAPTVLTMQGLRLVSQAASAVVDGIQLEVVLETLPADANGIPFERAYPTTQQREQAVSNLFTGRINQQLTTNCKQTSTVIV